MKKHLLFFAVAVLGFAACTNKGFDPDDIAQQGEKEQSYMAVSLLADDMTTRATGAGYEYEDGDASERVVKSLYFFLFDSEGNPFVIADSKNYKEVTINETGSDPDSSIDSSKPEGTVNVSDVKNKVLVFENYKGKYPSKIVAVLNWAPPVGAASYSLNALAEQIAGLKNAAGAFVMSNAVYATDNVAIRATALSPANIAKSEAAAKENPVQIYVERIAAKVTVSATAENKYDTGKAIDGKKVYAKVTGWDLYNEYEISYLLKKINPAWTDVAVGFNWNDAAWLRSYWAMSQTSALDADANKVSYATLSNAVGGSDYCGENTYNAHNTKVVVKALLVDDSNNPVEVATWYGNSYVGETALRTVVANTLAAQLYYKDGAEYKSIVADHLMVKEASDYHVYFQLSAAGESKDWYTYSTATGFKTATDDAVNVILKAVEPALLYNDGQTYYYTDIKHLPSTVDATKLGVVRNHVYKVNVNSVAGFGTPVYNADTKFDPEKPADVNTFVSAEVRVLSWRVVEYGYDL